MVLPPPTAHDASDSPEPAWLRRLKVALGLSRAGLLVLVDHAVPERLGELVRALYPIAPELEVYTEAHRLAEAPPGSHLVLVPRIEDADWLNINRPLFASRALRIVLFCTREVAIALSRRAVDFLDWISLWLKCPPGPAPYAVAGLRCALVNREPGILWAGGDLEASFAAARPHSVLRRISAARPYGELVTAAEACGRKEWPAWTAVEGEFQLQRVRWALAEARRRTRAIMVEPTMRSPGWWEVHGRITELGEARDRLMRAGAKKPGRLAALVDLEPEALELLLRLLERGVGEPLLEEEMLKGRDPGVAVGRLAIAHGLVPEKELIHATASPPAMRAFAADRSRMKRLRAAELDAIEQRLRRGEQVDPENAAWWAAWAGALPSTEALEGLGTRGEAVEVLLRLEPRTGETWERLAFLALSVGDMDAAHRWSEKTSEVEPGRWGAFVTVLREQGRLAEAESILRHALAAKEPLSDMDRRWVHHNLAYVLHEQGRNAAAEQLLRQVLPVDGQDLRSTDEDSAASFHLLADVIHAQGRYADAEKMLHRALAMTEQALGTSHPSYALLLRKLADVLEGQGQYSEAEKLLLQCLAAAEQRVGSQHPSYASLLHDLAWLLERQGRYEEAEKALHQSLALKEQVHGAQHPEYADSLHDLAGVYLRQGRYEEAEGLLRQSLAIAMQTVGPEHPLYTTSLHDLARALQWRGRYSEAEAMLRQVLGLSAKALGSGNPSYGKTLHQLGMVLNSQGRYSEAEAFLRQALEIFEQGLGPRHPELSPTLATLGTNLSLQGRPQDGESLLERSFELARESLGAQHPQTAQVLSLLAELQAKLQKPEAATTAQQAMDALRNALGPEHPITKTWLPGLRQIIADKG